MKVLIMRGSWHAMGIREFLITINGSEVKDSFANFERIIGGVPHRIPTDEPTHLGRILPIVDGEDCSGETMSPAAPLVGSMEAGHQQGAKQTSEVALVSSRRRFKTACALLYSTGEAGAPTASKMRGNTPPSLTAWP